MRYRSTRGGSTGRTFAEVLIEGLAPDGGLYVPETYPTPARDRGPYADQVASVVGAFVGDDPLAAQLPELCEMVYAGFDHPEVAPISQVGDVHLLELIWGPTLSFKDYALQLVGALFDRLLERRAERLLILGATSGDTGSAAVEACRGRPSLDIVILYPEGAVSEVQRRQMTTVPDDNVHVIAVDGTFDDCQRLVKAAFRRLGDRLPLGAINSINWGRIAAQSAYYWYASRQLETPRFVIPTGNFGNALSAHVARRMGAPMGSISIANNANHGLSDLVNQGRLEVTDVASTVAPAMDIQIPSNLERWLFEATGEDPDQIDRWQAQLDGEKRLELSPKVHARLQQDFSGGWVDDATTRDAIRRTYETTGILLDPHTAIAWQVASRMPAGVPRVVVATAHPAKFGETVELATGIRPEMPPSLAAVLEMEERKQRIPATLDALEALLVTAAS